MKLFLFFFNFFFGFLSPQCLPSCLHCQPNYYDQNFLSDFRLSYSKSLPSNCQLQKSVPYSRKVLITNALSCLNENLTSYDDCYTNPFVAFQAENRKLLPYSNPILQFDFTPGNHFLLKLDLEYLNENLFRQSNCSITLGPKGQNDKVSLFIKTNEFYFFVSGNFTVENLDFIAQDFEIFNVNATDACYNSINQSCCQNGCTMNPPSLTNMTNLEKYGFFTMEGLLGEPQNFANLIIKNSSFHGFKPIYLQYGWVRFIVIGNGGSLLINGSQFENCYWAGGFIDFPSGVYDGVSGLLNSGEYNRESKSIIVTNSEFMGINQQGWGNLGFFRIEGGVNIVFNVQNTEFNGFNSEKCLFCLENSGKFQVFNVSVQYFNATILFNIGNLNDISLDSMKISNLVNNNQSVFSFKNLVKTIVIENVLFKNSTSFSFFSLLNLSSFILTNTIVSNLSLNDSFVRSVSSTINLTNVTFYKISCKYALFYLQQSPYSSIKTASFSFLKDIYSIFMITSCSTFEISNILIRLTDSYNVFLLSNTLLSLSTFLQISYSSFTNIFSTDHSCFNTTMISSSIENNNISSKIVGLFTMSNIIFAMNGCYVSDNNLTQVYMIKMIVGFVYLNATIFRKIFFLNTHDYQFGLDFESNNIATISSCVFEDIGVITVKTYYLTKSHNGILSFWTIKSAKLSDSVFLVGKKIDLASGFIQGVPLGNYFYCVRNTFIIWDTNNVDGFKYKGIILDHSLVSIFADNRFFNLRCNALDFYHAHGGVLIAAGSSFSYTKNNYNLVMINNTFSNCYCLKTGALAIIAISQVTLLNTSFCNNTAPLYAGHLLVAAGDLLNVSQIYLTNSSSGGDGGAIFLQNFLVVKITQLSINGCLSSRGALNVKTVKYFELKAAFITNLTTLTTAGFLFIYQTYVLLQNISIGSVSTNLDGGALYISGGSSLYLLDAFFYQITSNSSGGAINFANCGTVFLQNTTFISCSSFDKGGIFFFDFVQGFTGVDIKIIDSFSLGNGVIFIKTVLDSAIFDFQRLLCHGTYAIMGSCIYYISGSVLKVSGLDVSNSKSVALYFFWSFEINILIEDVFFSETKIHQNLVIVSGVYLSAKNWNFFNNTVINFIVFEAARGDFQGIYLEGNEGANIFNLQASSAQISNMTTNSSFGQNFSVVSSVSSVIFLLFLNVSNVFVSSSSQSLFDLAQSRISIINSNFTENFGTIMSASQSNVTVKSSVFVKNTNFLGDSIMEIVVKNSILFYLEKITFQTSCGILIRASKVSNITILAGFFENILDPSCDSSALNIYDVTNFLISNTIFQNFNSGNLKLFTTDQSEISTILIHSCYFQNNSGNVGSVIFLSGNFNVSLQNSSFVSNKALNTPSDSGIAACLFFKPLAQNLSSLTVQSTNFTNNSADFISATIFSQIPILSSNNIFANNREHTIEYNHFFSDPLNLELKDASSLSIVSGQEFIFELRLTNFYNRTLFFDNKTFLLIKPKPSENTTSVIIKNDLAQSHEGFVTWKSLIVKSQPHSKITLTISGLFLGFQNSVNFNPYFFDKDFTFSLRECLLGEIILSDNSCFFCPKGTYSFLDPMKTEVKYQKCNPCPANCFCFGGSRMVPLPGYYRISNTSFYGAACENSNACLGSSLDMVLTENFTNDENGQGLCRIGNTDTLCFYCEYGYGKTEKTDYCKECASLGALIYGRALGCVFVVIVYIIMNFQFAEKFDSEDEKNSTFSSLFKILVNYSQQITILFFSTTELPLVSVREIFNVFDYMSFSNEHVMTNDCLMQKIYYDKETMIIFMEVFNALLPIFFSVLSFFFWILLGCIFNSFHIFKRFNLKLPQSLHEALAKVQVFIFLSIFIFYSLIVKSCFWLFNCMSVDVNDQRTYLRESPNILCWDKNHLTYVFVVGLPGLLIWGFGFPFVLFLFLHRNHKILIVAERSFSIRPTKKSIFSRQNSKFPEKGEISIVNKITINANDTNSELNLDQKSKEYVKMMKNVETSKVFVFFYKDFSHNYYFWECLIFLRKLILTFLSSMGGTMPLEIIHFLMLLIIFVSLFTTIFSAPYKFPSANKVEIFSLIVCLITISSVYFFNSESPDWLKKMVSVVCILFNAGFLIFTVVLIVFDLMKSFKRNKRNGKKIVAKNLTKKDFFNKNIKPMHMEMRTTPM